MKKYRHGCIMPHLKSDLATKKMHTFYRPENVGNRCMMTEHPERSINAFQ